MLTVHGKPCRMWKTARILQEGERVMENRLRMGESSDQESWILAELDWGRSRRATSCLVAFTHNQVLKIIAEDLHVGVELSAPLFRDYSKSVSAAAGYYRAISPGIEIVVCSKSMTPSSPLGARPAASPIHSQ